MKVYLKDEHIGDWPHGRTPTLPEMFRVKSAMPEFKNPVKFLEAAIEIVKEVPVLDPDTGRQKLDEARQLAVIASWRGRIAGGLSSEEGRQLVEALDEAAGPAPAVEHVPNDNYDPAATAMWLSLVYQRAGQKVRFEDIDCGFEDLRLEPSEEEKTKAEQAQGKAPDETSENSSTETPKTFSSDTHSDSPSSTD